jgi:autotransporter-associated beta strand protein
MSASLVVIDSNLPDFKSLITALPADADAEVHIIEQGIDGFKYLAEVLAERQDIEAIHILGHGSAGQAILGTARLNAASLDEYSDELAIIGEALTTDGDILLYGCNVAADATGVDFIGSVAELTGADVAASDDLTGADGDWVLELQSGGVEADSLFGGSNPIDYQYNLSSFTVNTVNNTGDDGSYSSYAADETDGSGLSLYEAVFRAFNGETISFDASLDNQTITLAADTYVGTNGVTLNTDNVPNLTIDSTANKYLKLQGDLTIHNGSGDSLTIDGIISNASGFVNKSLTKTGDGTLYLGSNNHTYSGPTTISGGTLAAYQVGGSSGIIIDGGTLSGDSGFYQSIPVIVTNNGGTIDLSGGNVTFFSGKLAGTGGLTVNGSGSNALTLRTRDDYSGNITLSNSARLQIEGNDITTGTITVDGGTGRIQSSWLDGAEITNDIFLNGNLDLGGVKPITFSGNIDLGGASRTITNGVNAEMNFTGIISNGDLVIQPWSSSSGDKVNLSGNNTFNSLQIKSNTGSDIYMTVVVGSDAALGNGTVTINQGTLQVTATETIDNEINILNSGTIEVDSGQTVTLSGALSGAGALTKTGAGTLSFTGTNTHTGTVTVEEGILDLNGTSIGNSAAVTATRAP